MFPNPPKKKNAKGSSASPWAYPASVRSQIDEVAAAASDPTVDPTSLRHVALVRYDAFADVGGRLSYSVAVLAKENRIPFYVAAPLSTIDLGTSSGADIPIEERGREEVAEFAGSPVVPKGVPVRHPAFDITPAALVDAIVTERGIIERPDRAKLAAHMA